MLNVELESFFISSWIKKRTLSAPRNSAFWWRWWRPGDLLSLSSWQKVEGLCLAFLPLGGPDSLLIVLFLVRPWPGAKLNLLSQGRVCSHEWEWAPSPAQSLAFPTPPHQGPVSRHFWRLGLQTDRQEPPEFRVRDSAPGHE